MRVLTYNIHGWRTTDGRPNLAALGDVIAATQADVVGLNEVFYPRRVEGADAPALEALAARLGMYYVFGPCMRWPAQDELPADAYGNALLSRYPILASAAHHLTPVPGKEQRGLLEARLALPGGQPFTVYVTHLDHTDEEARVVQLRGLRTWTIRDRNRPHVVVGDFNAISVWDHPLDGPTIAPLTQNPHAAHMVDPERKGPQVVAQMEKAGYLDAYTRTVTPQAQTFIPATDPPIRIDYIFVSAPLAPALRGCDIWMEAPDSEASDHRPVWADFDLLAAA